MTRAREATEDESKQFLAGSPGYVIEDGGTYHGVIGWCILSGQFFVHSLVSHSGGWVVAVLAQAVRKKAKALGFEQAVFHVKRPYLDLLSHADGERVRVDFAILSMKV